MNSHLELLQLASFPVVGALIGWFTNYVAVKMLFRPHKPIRVLGITFQGVVPKRQKELAVKIAQTVETNLISHRDVQEVLQSPESTAQIERLIDAEIDLFLKEKLAMIPMVSMFLQGDLAAQIKSTFIGQFRNSIPRLLEGLMEKVERDLNFQELVTQKIMAFDLLTLERIIYDISGKELRTIEILGGVLGLIVGLGQAALVFLMK